MFNHIVQFGNICEMLRLRFSTLRRFLLCFFSLVVLGSTGFAAVDYAVFSVSMNKNQVAPGDPIIATIVMKNVGTTASTKISVTDVRFLSQSSRALPINGKVGQFNVAALAASQSVEVQIAFYVPSVADGVYYIWAIGDNTSTLGQPGNALENDYGRGAAITVARATTSTTTPTTTTPTTTTPTTTTPTTTTNPTNSGSVNTTPATNPGGTTTNANSTTSTITLSANSSSFAWTTSVYSYTPNVARSGAVDEKIRLGGWGDTYQGYLKFELTGITAPVQSAKLRLFVLPDENQTTPFRIMRITNAWSASTAVAWASQPSMVELTQIAAPSWQSWVEIDMTTLVNGWIRGDFPNHGIAFLPTRTDRAFTTFASPGNADAAKRPQFVVVSSAPATTTPTNTSPVATIPQPNFSSRFYTTDNIFWQGGFAPSSTNPPNPKLGGSAGNCTWSVHGRGRELGYDAGQLNVLSGDAGTWDDRARAAGIQVDTTPTVGAIAQSKTQNHVGWVESVNADGTFTVSESSYVPDLTSSWNFLWRTRTVSPGWFSAFIHVTKTATTTSTAPTTTTTTTPVTSPTNPANSTTNPTTNTGGTTTTAPTNNNLGGNTTGGTTTGTNGNASSGTSPSTAVITTTLGNQPVAAPSSKIISISTLSVTPLISGFNISGDTPKKLVVRAVGPTLAQFSVSGVLADPQVRVFDSSGRQVAQNDDWDGSTELHNAFTAVGLFGLPVGSKDAAMIVTLSPGVYTAQVATKGGATGLAILEIYEVP